jgi:subtilase family serine protease
LTVAFLLVFSSVAVLQTRAIASTATPTTASKPLTGFRLIGEAPQDLPVLLNIAIPLRNTGLLSSMTQEVSDPSSPLFRHFLSPAQIQQDFLPTAAYDVMLNQLQTDGFHIVMTALSSFIIVSATAAQVRSYFHGDVSLYTNGTASYYETSGASAFQGARFYASNATAFEVKPRIVTSTSGAQGGNTTVPANDFSAKELQAVYNATYLYAQGDQGKGETIGLMDFFGSPSVTQDLQIFDQKFGFPASNFTISPIGPYDPNYGVAEGWNEEIALDVELSHAMAPLASEIMYVPSNALTLSASLAPVVQADNVGTLSQSFGWYEADWQASDVGAASFYFNVLLADQQYMLGSLEGISFLVASGDGGGSGFSNGPLGNLDIPDASPYVTSVGGSQTYIYTLPNGTEKFTQTTWSNQAFVPNLVNYGGGTGGVSGIEPKPWYQQNESTPASFPNGRMEPDLVLQAGVDPATYYVAMGQVGGVGGTSESSPLFAGLLALIAESTGGRLGLVTPTLYVIGNDPSLRSKIFVPTPIGYTIPWVSREGYNLASGWGAPNIGELAQYYSSVMSQPGLNVSLTISNPATGQNDEFTPGQSVDVQAVVATTGGASPSNVTTGSFTADLDTLTGISGTTSMSYNSTSGAWTASIPMGNLSGLTYVNVQGTSAGLKGEGTAEFFAGYLATFLSPTPVQPWTTIGGLPVLVNATDINGNPAPAGNISMVVDTYSILYNTYTTVDSVQLSAGAVPYTGSLWGVTLNNSYPTGPTGLILQGDTYGFLPFTNGIYLQTTEIFPQVAAEPGAIAPGQSLLILASPEAPLNIAQTPSFETGLPLGTDIANGANVTAFLVSPTGRTVATADIIMQPCLQYAAGCTGGINDNGELTVPSDATPGLYLILLTANYTAITLQDDYDVSGVNGSFFGQVMVTGPASLPLIQVTPSILYQGQTAQIVADIHYSNGTEARFGEYSAFVYPQDASVVYTDVNFVEYLWGHLVQLSYSSTLNRWVGNFTAPSPYNSAYLSPVTAYALDYSGPYDAFVTGHSFDGTPTVTDESAGQAFFIQPYTLVANQTLSSLVQTSGLAFSGDTISASATLSNDVFLGSNTIRGTTVAISDSSIQGTLNVDGAQLNLTGVSGGAISATDSRLQLADSSVGSLSLIGSTVSLVSSTYKSVTPTLPTIQIQMPSWAMTYSGVVVLSGVATISAAVSGGQITSVTFSVDGTPVQTSTNGSATYGYALDATKLADGSHTLTVTVLQQDGISTSASAPFITDSQLVNQSTQLGLQNQTIQSQAKTISSLNNSLNSADGKISDQGNTISDQGNTISDQGNTITSLTYGLYALAAVAIVALAVAIVAVTRRPPARSSRWPSETWP